VAHYQLLTPTVPSYLSCTPHIFSNMVFTYSNSPLSVATPPAVLYFVQQYDVTRITNATNLSLHIGQNGQIILTYRSSSTSQVTCCRNGRLPHDSSKIDWKDQEVSFQSNKCSRFHINDNGAIIEIYESRYLRKCYLRFGLFNKDYNGIDWKSDPFQFASGVNPSASQNNNGTVLVTFESGVIRRDSYYGVGKISEGSNTISWNTGFMKFRSNCCDISSDLNDHRTVVLSARTYQHSFVLFVGYINSDGKLAVQIMVDDPSAKFGLCVDAAVSLSRAGHIVWLKAQEKRVLVITGQAIRSHDKKDGAPPECKLVLNMAATVDRPLQQLSTCISSSGLIGFSYQSPQRNGTDLFCTAGRLFPGNAVERLIQSPYVTFFP